MKRHPIDSVSLVFALLFAAAVAWWAVATISDDPLHVPAAWVGAGTLLIIGLVGLISALRPQREPVAAGPMTVSPEPPMALTPDPDLYSDPYFEATKLTRADVLDAEAVAAAYREAGFEDPETVAVPIRPSAPPVEETTPTEAVTPTEAITPEEPAGPTENAAPTEAAAPSEELHPVDEAAVTKELPASEPPPGSSQPLR